MSPGVNLFNVMSFLLTVHFIGGDQTNFDRTVDLRTHHSVQEGLPTLDGEPVLQKPPPITGATSEKVTFIDPNLPTEHYPYYFTQHPHEANICQGDVNCLHKDALDKKACWGYEQGCARHNITNYPYCSKHQPGWVRTIEEQQDLFWSQADFGYIKRMREGQVQLCEPRTQNGSSIECSPNMMSCHVRNFVFNFTGLHPEKTRKRFDDLPEGYASGDCSIDHETTALHSTHKGDLQSWVKELGNVSSISTSTQQKRSSQCDIVLDKPTYLMKLDAGVNMYHHFCDYVNLYLTMHYNQSFSSDINIVMWDTSAMMYGDFFGEMWQAFTDYPIIELKDWDGKVVCLQDGVFTTLPRMQRGFFYNMPMVPDCHGSALMRAFSQHVLHRLDVQQRGPVQDKLRITFLARNSKHRNVINQNELLDELRKNSDYDVSVVAYSLSEMSLVEQFKVTHNSDIFIGMHGAGLTHLLFLPDWAVIFELCNCEDERCYKDLANLRGVHYMTWENWDLLQKLNEVPHPSLGTPHAKFCDYTFDKAEFVRLVEEAAHHVRNHPKYGQKQNHDEL